MRLAQLQAVFQRFLLEGDPSIASEIADSARVPVQTRLAIYGDGYPLRLTEALQHSFPALAALLGEERFTALARSYIALAPSTFRSIRYYGDQLANFLASEASYAGQPQLAELARWEWAMAAVFDAEDAIPVGTEALAQLEPASWAQLQFHFVPALEVVPLQWNTAQLWKALTEGHTAPEPLSGAAAADWLLWRQELQIYFRQLSPTEAGALAAARAGESFGELCERLCAQLDEQDAARHAAAFLRGWLEAGLIVAVHITNPGA